MTESTRPLASASELERWRTVAIEIADEAAAIAMRGFRRGIRVDTKPDRSFVTEADRGIERLARERLRAAFPGCGLVGEEEGTETTASAVTWYIDPIDATANFVRGIPIFATLLAVALDGELQLGLVSAPAMPERWLAWRGGGAWRGSDRIEVSKIATIEESHLIYGSERAFDGGMPGITATLQSAWRNRGFGDYWGHMLVAEGAAEAMVEAGAHAWDWAAPFVIVEEAGGRFTTLEGERRFDGGTAISTDGVIHDELLRRLSAR